MSANPFPSVPFSIRAKCRGCFGGAFRGVHASLQLRGDPSFRVRCLPGCVAGKGMRETPWGTSGTGSTAVALETFLLPFVVLGPPLTTVGMRAPRRQWSPPGGRALVPLMLLLLALDALA